MERGVTYSATNQLALCCSAVATMDETWFDVAPGVFSDEGRRDYSESVPKFWITYTEAARNRLTPFRPNHMVPAERYELDGGRLIFTSGSPDGVPRPVLEVRNEDVARIEWIEGWLADQRKSLESEAYRRGSANQSDSRRRKLGTRCVECHEWEPHEPANSSNTEPDRLLLFQQDGVEAFVCDPQAHGWTRHGSGWICPTCTTNSH